MLKHVNFLKDLTVLENENPANIVTMPDEKYKFLHEAAVIYYDGALLPHGTTTGKMNFTAKLP